MASLAKITPPKLQGVYARERLFTLLDAAREQPAVWVHGLPGAGKTTLVASYLAARGLRPLWYRLDEDDADPATLFYYLGLAAKQAAPRKKKVLPLFTPEYLRGLPAFTRRYFRELYDRLPRPFTVIFDNYQDVGVETRVHDVMQYALEEVPDHGNVIVMSRAEPPEQLARYRANGLLQTIGPDAMRLTSEEIKGIVHSRLDAALDSDCLRQLAEQTQGWAAGLALLLEWTKTKLVRPEITSGATPQAIFDYFAGEILRRIDSETRDVLLMTALLPATTASLADRLTGRARTAVILEQLCRNNYFTLRDGQTEPVYQYHPLFREFLLKQAHQAFTSERLEELKCSAATLLEADGQIEAAIDLRREAEDWSGMVKAILHSASALLEQGRNATLLRWLSSLPRPFLDATPWLLYWRARANLPTSPSLSYSDLEHALDLFRQKDDAAGQFASWAELCISIWWDTTGDYRRLDQWLALLPKLIADNPTFPSREIEWAVAFSAFGSIYFRMPQHLLAEVWRDRAVTLARDIADVTYQVQTAHMASLYHLLRGDYARAALDLSAMAALEKRLGERLDPRVAAVTDFAYAWYQLYVGDFDGCSRTVTMGLTKTQKSGVHTWDYMLRCHGVFAAISLGDLARARSMLKDWAADSQVSAGMGGIYYHLLSGWYALLNGDLAAAREHADVGVELADRLGMAHWLGISRLALAQVKYQQGDHQSARQSLTEAFDNARETGSRSVEHMCLMVRADFDLREGNEDAGLAALREGLALGREQKYVNFHWWLSDMMSRLCARALQAEIETDYVCHIIRARKLLPESPDIENWPWPVQIYTLGRFALLIDDQALVFGHKAPKKTIALLKALIANGGRDVSAPRLIDSLWPEAEGDAAHKAFDIALHRLRKLLRHPEALQIQEGRLALNDKLCWVDTWAFERLLADAETAAPQDNAQAAQRGIERGLALYHGAFLAQETDSVWSASLRERLRAKFIHHVARLANRRADAGNFEDALKLYQRGLEADDLAEEFYQGVMRCYQNLGRYAEALAVYRRLRQTFSITLGVPPSPASQAMFRALRDG